jgi:hypothetical protein
MAPRAVLTVLAAAALLITQHALAAHLRLEFAGRYTTSDHTSVQRPGEDITPRVLPTLALILDQSVGAKLSVGPVLRYAQQGEKTSWHYLQDFGGTEQSLEHVVSGGLALRYRMPHSIFLSVDPEISYLAAGVVEGTSWFSNQPSVVYRSHLDNRSDRWNAVAGVGLGTYRHLAGGAATIQLSYVSEINTMTRTFDPGVSQSQRNIAWTSSTSGMYSSEYRSHAIEVVLGYAW